MGFIKMARMADKGLEICRRTTHFKPDMPTTLTSLTDSDYTRLADFRYALRRFLEFSEIAAGAEGLTPQQHQALLAIRGHPAAVCHVGYLAERLCIRPNTAAELAQRLEAGGLISRRTHAGDRRSVELALTTAGMKKLEFLSRVHRAELKQLRPEIVALFQSLETGEPS
jgi:DNA-binding MarR family transcriptional regulator